MEQSNSSKQVLLAVVGVAILVVAIVGVSFAFFNYTRTGSENSITTGQINFSTEQSMIEVSNLFPIDASTITKDTTANVARTVVTINGNTTYANGIHYEVTAVGVDLKGLPISVKVFKDTGATVSNATLNQYTDSSHRLANNSVLASGDIAPNGSTSATGNIYVVAYFDIGNVIITDTPDDQSQAPTGYTDGTVTTGKEVISTADWNALGTTGNAAVFKVKVEANERTTPIGG